MSPLKNISLRSWRYCVGVRLKFWRRSRVPKKGSRDEAVETISRGFATRDGSAAKSHSTTIQYPQLRRLKNIGRTFSHDATAAKQ